MLNSKQRAKLKGIASTTDALVTIGKDGLTDTILKEIENVLVSREIAKISVLDTSEHSAKEYLSIASQKLAAEEVCSIGKKFVLYKRSNKKGIKHIEI